MDAGRQHVLVVKTGGSLWGMGQNGEGQLGDGSTTDRHVPVHWGDDAWPDQAGHGDTSHSSHLTMHAPRP